MVATPESLQKFIDFCKEHITGQERKEAQTFLDRFFKAFGYEGALEAGAKYEEAIKKASQKGKTGFADLIWKPKVLIEMKQRGEDLNKHYAQAFAYWQRLVPNRPRYVILCNFDEFWIFDFDNQLDEPVDKVALINLVERASAFAFMELGNRTPVFRNNQVEITEIAARRMGELFTTLQQRLSKESNSELIAQRFILQCVLAMFAEDRGLLPQDLFIACVQDCLQNKLSSYDIIGGLFREMNQTGITPAGRYKSEKSAITYNIGQRWAVTLCPEAEEKLELKVAKIIEYLDKNYLLKQWVISDIEATGSYGNCLTSRCNNQEIFQVFTSDLLEVMGEEGQVIELDASLIKDDEEWFKILIRDGVSIDLLGRGEMIPLTVLGKYVYVDKELFMW
ncbi:hypothetical protein PL8927_550095 [Planktothrix serta PCC 8927]|uniref:Class I SAM-dependent DNA methyltransferase n=1 Tax=Planktothrix serta PCC 8927 TaxID=671068 RepID=A0A7Z9BLE8_9CYAN|nr:type IIL restriction-modification enzyme MmeI [Planktothrix serta]VXD16772.1 hypothetical protein PL8927_550095 [Planktothrix serta PCC 8927]